MAQITAALVKELREKTGAGMMDCKKALNECEGELEAAIDWLRKKGLSAAAKKAGRVAAEGLVAVAVAGNKGAVVEVNAETDFVARNETFQNYVTTLAGLVLEHGSDLDVVKEKPFPGSERNVADELTHLIATIGENMSIRRAQVVEVTNGVVCSYVHNALLPNLGKIGVLVGLETEADAGSLNELGRSLSMHAAAAMPQFLSIDKVDGEALERERTVLKEQALAQGKPENIVEKMVDGRIRKYYEEVVFLEQKYVIDGESKVSQAIEITGKALGKPIVLVDFARYQLGEGIEKQESDFAAEVAATAKA